MPIIVRSRQMLLDRASIVVFAALFSTATTRGLMAMDLSAPSISPMHCAIGAVGATIAAWVTADALAGLTHWFADRFFDEDTPWIGPLLIAPFRAHHVDPGSIARHDFATVSGNAALATTPVALALFALPAAHDVASLALFVFATVLTLALFVTNTLHRWAHAPKRSRAVRLLHRSGLVLTPSRHARHHRGDHDSAYCVTSGWLNPVFDGLGLFARLERLFRGRSARHG